MSFKIALQAVPLVLLVLLVVAILIPACASKPDTANRLREYEKVLAETASSAIAAEDPIAKTGIAALGDFLSKIGDKQYVSANTAKVYAENGYLNDTLVTHHGPEEIKDYFLGTADTMDTFKINIDDVSSSGSEYYLRWTMVFSAPRLNGGKPVESIGMSHVRVDAEGKILMQQDFWDSGTNIYGQLPILGGIIETIRRRFEK